MPQYQLNQINERGPRKYILGVLLLICGTLALHIHAIDYLEQG